MAEGGCFDFRMLRRAKHARKWASRGKVGQQLTIRAQCVGEKESVSVIWKRTERSFHGHKRKKEKDKKRNQQKTKSL